jgi:hypothetical protein
MVQPPGAAVRHPGGLRLCYNSTHRGIRGSLVLRNGRMVTVAQLAELWIVVPVVVGSSPIGHPIFV